MELKVDGLNIIPKYIRYEFVTKNNEFFLVKFRSTPKNCEFIAIINHLLSKMVEVSNIFKEQSYQQLQIPGLKEYLAVDSAQVQTVDEKDFSKVYEGFRSHINQDLYLNDPDITTCTSSDQNNAQLSPFYTMTKKLEEACKLFDRLELEIVQHIQSLSEDARYQEEATGFALHLNSLHIEIANCFNTIKYLCPKGSINLPKRILRLYNKVLQIEGIQI